MGKPLLFRSKLLCFSIFYLFTSIILVFYTTLSSTKCLFRSSPYDPLQYSLFSYNSSYGQHKYAHPTFRKSCKSPIFFQDYWKVFEEIKEFVGNSSTLLGSQVVKYMKGNADSFGGKFSIEERISYFNHSDDEIEIPCGFFKRFPISNQDQMALDRCNGVVVVSAIFNDHDKIRQPKGLGFKTLDNVCFIMFVDEVTLQNLDYHNIISRKSKEYNVGAWRIVKVKNEELYENAGMSGMLPKYLVHRLFPNAKYSIWVDGKLQLAIDPLLLIHSLIVNEDFDMAISKHPLFVQTIEDAMSNARWRKWLDVDGLKMQIETYCENGLQPWSSDKSYPSDVPDSALILRKHSVANNIFSCLMFNELEAFNPRDQIPFAYVRDKMLPKLKLNMFEAEVLEQITLEYRHNVVKNGVQNVAKGYSKVKRAGTDLFVNGSCSKCDRYLLNMWGEVDD